jgi:hypothetical protein
MAKFPQSPLNLIFKYLLHFAQNIEIKRQPKNNEMKKGIMY